MTTGPQKTRTLLLWLLGVPLLVGAGLFAMLIGSAIPPSPEALKKQFNSRRTALEALIQLMHEDGKDGFCLQGAGLAEMQAAVRPARLEEYRARMNEADVGCVFRRGEARIEIDVWGFGFPGTETSRGFAWSPESLPNEFACINWSCFPKGFKPKRWERVHERIAPEWAIYAF